MYIDLIKNKLKSDLDLSDFQVAFGNGETFTIPATDFAQLAFDIEHYAIFRLKEYKNRGCI